MALPGATQLKYWTITTVVFLVILWALGNVILPFVLGMAIAYFLDPVADRLEKMGLSRAIAVTIITLVAVLVFVLMALLVIPSLVNQAINLVQVAPQVFDELHKFMTERFPQLFDESSTIRQSLATLGETIRSKGVQFFEAILASVGSLINVVVLIVIVPVVAFYLLYDWDRMVAEIDQLLPRDHAPTIRQLAHDIDKTLASFIRGMGTVCLILGTYYAIALMLVGLQFGLIVGAIAGLVTFIPYLGAIIGGALAIGLAFFQFWGDRIGRGDFHAGPGDGRQCFNAQARRQLGWPASCLAYFCAVCIWGSLRLCRHARRCPPRRRDRRPRPLCHIAIYVQ